MLEKQQKRRRRTLASLVEAWEVDRTTAVKWRRDALPIHDDQLLARALLRRKRVSVKIRRKALAKLRQAVERSEPTKVVEERIETTTLGMVEDLEREGQRLQRQQQEAANAGDYLQENILLEARIKLYRSLIGIRADLREMGEDRGRTIGREEFERMIRAMAGRAAKSIALACARFGEKLLGLTRMEQVVAILEPRLVQAMFVEPFAEAVHFKSEQNLPAWVEETIRRVCGNFIADGEAALDGALESRAA